METKKKWDCYRERSRRSSGGLGLNGVEKIMGMEILGMKDYRVVEGAVR